MARVLALLALAAAQEASVAPLTVVSAANGRYALKELAVLLEVKDRARHEDMDVRLISSACPGSLSGPGVLWPSRSQGSSVMMGT